MTTLGEFVCDMYNLVRYSWRASRDWRCSFGGVGNKIQSIHICFGQSEFLFELFQCNLNLNLEEFLLQRL